MASEVDINNLALARVGDEATVASLSPPEGSAQAEHCSIFYPIARDSLLQMHTWNFSTKRQNGALLASPTTGWQYAYAVPQNSINVFAILPPGSTNDYSTVIPPGDITTLADGSLQSPPFGSSLVQPQPFVLEINDDNESVIYTDQADAVIRYAVRITDTTKFSPLFTDCLGWLLASYIAGPIYKGEVGVQISAAMMKGFNAIFSPTKVSDTNQRSVKPQHIPAWIAGR